MQPMRTRSGLATAFANLWLATLFLAFAYAHLRAFVTHPRLSPLLVVLLETAFAAFLVVRRSAISTSTTRSAWISTIAGTFMPLFMRPTSAAHDLPAAQAVQILGLTVGIASTLSLNRSIGLLPAHRGIQSRGAYRWVRHPLYASYFLAQAGYIASNLGAWNILIFVAGLSAQLVRIRGEERLLSEDPAYVAYKSRTRWRLFPLVY
jgi:protein-S-isoprenylcysteine O-methyltransferase Ste14